MQRSWDNIEQKLRKECLRPGFANSAWWTLPYGNDPKKYPKGLSIRFAEAALRMAGNIDVQVQAVFDDSWKRIVRITVLDLETNFAYTTESVIDKAVERTNPAGREVLAVRQNSVGKMTYLVAATEQELALKQGSAVSKAIRTQGLRLIPGDILDECKALIEATRAKGAQAEDPEAARKVILDNFAEIGVMPADLAKYLGHDTDIFQPAERELLRGLFVAIRNGDATWKDAMEAKFGTEGEESAAAKSLKEKLAKRTAKPQATPETTQTPAPPEQEKAATEEPKSAEEPAKIHSFDEWPDDPFAAYLGTEIQVGGKWYRRPNTSGDSDWKEVKAPKAANGKKD